jgi:hypothetical protein
MLASAVGTCFFHHHDDHHQALLRELDTFLQHHHQLVRAHVRASSELDALRTRSQRLTDTLEASKFADEWRDEATILQSMMKS